MPIKFFETTYVTEVARPIFQYVLLLEIKGLE